MHDPLARPLAQDELVTRCAEQTEDPRLVAALDEYLLLLESGSPPDRHEFLSRHPEIADELDACLDGLAFVQDIAPQIDETTESATKQLTTLGDFRLIREIGRGGMGVVYEAEQLSLRRRVAVKILPLAGMLDQKQLARFRNEAHAAAQLHHTNIVPVFSVGCERGVHYYAMQFIEGQSLAEVIEAARGEEERGQAPGIRGQGTKSAEQRRQQLSATVCRQDQTPVTLRPLARPGPSAPGLATPVALVSANRSGRREFFHAAAKLGIQAAEALEHAHERGVVHRDIKPANLLLEPDGALWITDFGLARMESHASLTTTGDIVGTLRYMSPEQALGQPGLVDQRTDIYSLGATLYELLTLQGVFTGGDRRELLRQITHEEPRAPRRINRHIPLELQTILLKTLEKDPSYRYQSARDLAEDLRRFVDDRPIQAKPPGLSERTLKWVRRHQAQAVSAVLALLVAVVALLVSTVLVVHQRNLARTSLTAAETAQQREIAQRLTAERERKSAEQERDHAAQNLYIANIRMAKAAWDAANIDRMRLALDACLPATGKQDFRGWEWHYLDGLTKRELATLAAPMAGIEQGLSKVSWNSQNVFIAALVRQRQTADVNTSTKQSLKVWNTATAAQVLEIESPTGWITDYCWSPSGNELATIDHDGQVAIHEPDRPTPLRSFAVDDFFPNTSISWSPDGSKLAAVVCPLSRSELHMHVYLPRNRNPTLYVLDAASGAELFRFTEPCLLFSELFWSPGGGALVLTVATAEHLSGDDANGVLRVWNSTDWKSPLHVPLWRSHWNNRSTVAWSQDGDELALIQDGGQTPTNAPRNPAADSEARAGGPRIEFWEHATKRRLRSFPTKVKMHSLAWDHAGKRMLTTVDDQAPARRMLKAWDAVLGSPMLTVAAGQLSQSPGSNLACTADGRRIAAGLDRKVGVWDTTTGEQVAAFRGHHGPVTDAVWSPDGLRIASAATDGIKIWSFSASEEFEILHKSSSKLAASTDDRLYSMAAYDELAWVAETADGAKVHQLARAPAGTATDASPRSGLALAGHDAAPIWDGATSGQITDLNRPAWAGRGDRITTAAWSTGGRLFAAGTFDAELSPDIDEEVDSVPVVRIWDSHGGAELPRLRGHAAAIRHLAWSNDSLRIASCDDHANLKVWNARTGAVLFNAQVRAAASGPFVCGWSQSGKLFAAVNANGQIQLWNCADWKPVSVIGGPQSGVTGLLWCSDDRRLISNDGREIRVWDVQTREELLCLGPYGFLSPLGLAYSEQSQRLFALSKVNEIICWQPGAHQSQPDVSTAPAIASVEPAAIDSTLLTADRDFSAGMDASTLAVLYDKARRYTAEDEHARAEVLWRDLWQSRRAMLGPQHALTIDAQHLLGVCLTHLARYSEAEQFLLDSYTQARSARGVHPDSASTYHRKLIELYDRWGKPEQAAWWREAWSALDSEPFAVMAPPTTFRAYLLYRYGRVLIKNGMYAQAESNLRECVAIREKLSPDGWNTFNAHSNLGLALLDQRRFAEAEKYLLSGYEGMYQRRDKISGDEVDDNQGRLPEALERLIRLYDAWGKPEQAAQWREVAAIRQPQQPALTESQAVRRARALYHDSIDLLRSERYTHAETLLRECTGLREQHQPDLWTTFNARSHLGWAVLGQNRYAEAEPLLISSYEGLKQRRELIDENNRDRLPEALQRVVWLYDAWDKPDQAAKWRKEREQLPVNEE